MSITDEENLNSESKTESREPAPENEFQAQLAELIKKSGGVLPSKKNRKSENTETKDDLKEQESPQMSEAEIDAMSDEEFDAHLKALADKERAAKAQAEEPIDAEPSFNKEYDFASSEPFTEAAEQADFENLASMSDEEFEAQLKALEQEAEREKNAKAENGDAVFVPPVSEDMDLASMSDEQFEAQLKALEQEAEREKTLKAETKADCAANDSGFLLSDEEFEAQLNALEQEASNETLEEKATFLTPEETDEQFEAQLQALEQEAKKEAEYAKQAEAARQRQKADFEREAQRKAAEQETEWAEVQKLFFTAPETEAAAADDDENISAMSDEEFEAQIKKLAEEKKQAALEREKITIDTPPPVVKIDHPKEKERSEKIVIPEKIEELNRRESAQKYESIINKLAQTFGADESGKKNTAREENAAELREKEIAQLKAQLEAALKNSGEKPLSDMDKLQSKIDRLESLLKEPDAVAQNKSAASAPSPTGDITAMFKQWFDLEMAAKMKNIIAEDKKPESRAQKEEKSEIEFKPDSVKTAEGEVSPLGPDFVSLGNNVYYNLKEKKAFVLQSVTDAVNLPAVVPHKKPVRKTAARPAQRRAAPPPRRRTRLRPGMRPRRPFGSRPGRRP